MYIYLSSRSEPFIWKTVIQFIVPFTSEQNCTWYFKESLATTFDLLKTLGDVFANSMEESCSEGWKETVILFCDVLIKTQTQNQRPTYKCNC